MADVTLGQVVRMDEFWGLPPTERRSFLLRFPEYSSLKPAEQVKFILDRPQKVVPFATQLQQGMGAVAHDIAGMVTGPLQALADPKGTGKAILAQQDEQSKQADETKGMESFSHRLASYLPLVGPAAVQTGEELGTGQYGKAAVHAAELLAPSAAKLLPKNLPVAIRRVKNLNNPVEEAALKSVEGEVRMTPGQRAKSPALQHSEQDLLNKPGTAAEAGEFYGKQREALAAAGRARVAGQPGAVTNAVGAGQAIHARMANRVGKLKTYGDKLYEDVKAATAANTQTVQTGTKTVPGANPSATLHPSGMPVQSPVYSTLKSPVDLAPIRAQLQPIYEDLQRYLPEARRANMPSYRALDELMRSGDRYANAMDFDKFLSAVKSITREGASQYLSDSSKGLAKQIIKAGESSFQSAVAGAGPGVVEKLQKARRVWRAYHEAGDFAEALRSEPAALYHNLVTGGDNTRNLLTDVQRVAPREVQTVGRTFLGELMDKATREGGWGRSAGVKADWERLGPEAKQILFGPERSKQMDDFLLAAKRLTTEGNPSHSADRLSALVANGDIGMAIAEFLGGAAMGHPGAGAVGAGITLLKTRVQPAMLARLTFRPGGATLLKDAITLPVNSNKFNQTMRALAAMAATEDERKAQPSPNGKLEAPPQ